MEMEMGDEVSLAHSRFLLASGRLVCVRTQLPYLELKTEKVDLAEFL